MFEDDVVVPMDPSRTHRGLSGSILRLKDGGQTWGNFRDITRDPEGVYGDYGYPGITWIEDGNVALVNFHALQGIRLARIDVNWFYGE